ncbi:probable serine/threonine-protein kinase clkA [Colletes gigas]|uniref:probable serine/threonine-protein kinase clkA n=1 Tax=Colletes gigas TaxID=935657 RepID=UPI001C9AEBA2|nr:probable serine/threonine-protein kinase clkA [Colletes gigas]
MADDHYCSQQQPPYQGVAAEEEIVSRDEDNRIPHYEDFKQFLLKKIQREFQTYDTNNNQVESSSIVDLRTATVSSDLQTIPLDNSNHTRSNLIPANNNSNIDSLTYRQNDCLRHQTSEDRNSNLHGSILLKKMLQAPVGANLGEIASPPIGGYRFSAMDHYQSNSLLDNSDTLTAESDNQDNNEENFENTSDCYGLLSSMKGEYLFNESNFVKHVDEIGQQITNVLTNENDNRYKYSTNNDTHQDYENWTITNVMDATDTNCTTSDLVQSSRIYQTMYYDNTGSIPLNKPTNDEGLTCQYRTIENVHAYNSSQNLFNFNATEESQYYETNIIPNMQSDSTSTHYLQNLIKFTTETNQEYFQNTHSYSNANINQDTYSSTVSQTFSNNNRYNSNTLCENSCSNNNQGNISLSENFEQQTPNCHSTVQMSESSTKKNVSSTVDKVKTNGILDAFWPKKFSKIPADPILESILNFIDTERIDLSKLDQTSCVHCYVAPIVTHSPESSHVICSQKARFVAEYRQHSFYPHWLLYNDSSRGMQMANLQTELEESATEEMPVLCTSILKSTPDLNESIEGTRDSIPEL